MHAPPSPRLLPEVPTTFHAGQCRRGAVQRSRRELTIVVLPWMKPRSQVARDVPERAGNHVVFAPKVPPRETPCRDTPQAAILCHQAQRAEGHQHVEQWPRQQNTDEARQVPWSQVGQHIERNALMLDFLREMPLEQSADIGVGAAKDLLRQEFVAEVSIDMFDARHHRNANFQRYYALGDSIDQNIYAPRKPMEAVALLSKQRPAAAVPYCMLAFLHHEADHLLFEPGVCTLRKGFAQRTDIETFVAWHQHRIGVEQVRKERVARAPVARRGRWKLRFEAPRGKHLALRRGLGAAHERLPSGPLKCRLIPLSDSRPVPRRQAKTSNISRAGWQGGRCLKRGISDDRVPGPMTPR